jgi:hypothetical protein
MRSAFITLSLEEVVLSGEVRLDEAVVRIDVYDMGSQ